LLDAKPATQRGLDVTTITVSKPIFVFAFYPQNIKLQHKAQRFQKADIWRS